MLCAPPLLLGESSFFVVGFVRILVLSLAFWSFHYCVPEVRVEWFPFHPSGPPRLIRFLDPVIPSSLLREFPLHPSFRNGIMKDVKGGVVAIPGSAVD